MSRPEGEGEQQQRFDGLFPVDPDGLEPEPGVSEVAEELTVDDAPDDGPQRTVDEDTAEVRHHCGAAAPVVSGPEGQCQQHGSVDDVAEHDAEEQRQEERHQRGRIDGAVGRNRQQTHQELKGACRLRVFEQYRRVISCLDTDLFHDDP